MQALQIIIFPLADSVIQIRLGTVSITLLYREFSVVFILDAQNCHCMKALRVFAFTKCVQQSKSKWTKLDS